MLQDPKKIKYLIISLIFCGMVFLLTAIFEYQNLNREKHIKETGKNLSPAEIAVEYNNKDLSTTVSVKPTEKISPTPIPSKKPLSFAEMNSLYGPCTVVPVLMYHHIQDMETARKEGHEKLTVDTRIFENQLAYIKDKNYTTITMSDLTEFFEQGRALPKKPIILTFDDGYDDIYTDAWPLLRKYNIFATFFIPTGLINNPGYLTWDQLKIISSDGLILLANHTWSHKDLVGNTDVIKKEIQTANLQLEEKGYDEPKIFAYPYGQTNAFAEKELQAENYKLAFTTKPGRVMCRKQYLELPRVRIGNAPLNEYGL